MENTKRLQIKKMVYSALFLALCLVLPFLTGGNPKLGNVLLLMHIPVLLCAYFCGPWWGCAVGAIAPVLRSLLFGKPDLLVAVFMLFELFAYGLIFGLLCRALPKKYLYLYVSLFAAQSLGRVFYAAVRFIFLGFGVGEFSFAYFWTGTILEAVPGILLQLVLIPPLAYFLRRYALESR